MERSSKFLSLSGWAGIMVGIYSLIASYFVYKVFNFQPDEIQADSINSGAIPTDFLNVFLTAVLLLFVSIITALFLSRKKASAKGEKAWNATSRRLLINMAVPLACGGILVLALISKGLIGMLAPLTLIFYGLALYNASKFTFEDLKILGIIQLILGLTAAFFIQYGLLLWALGFGVAHIVYGIYMHLRYER